MAINFSTWGQMQDPPSGKTSAIEPVILAASDAGTAPTTPVQLTATQDYNLYVYGNFGGATVNVEWSVDGVTFSPFQINGTDIDFVVQAFQYFYKLDAGIYIRLAFPTPGVGAAINAELR